jgi:glycine/D-amino acid oxidase-like deaminating enzyme
VPKYDLAVVGAGLGGLAAAALLSKQNKKALVVEPGNEVGGALGTFEKDGFVFTTSPALSFGFERGGALQELYETLGISHSASVLSPCYQVALPDRRITVYAEVSETQEELRREFPHEIDVIVAFYHDLRKEALRSSKNRLAAYFSRRRKAGTFIRKYRFSPELMAFFDIQSLVFFHQRVTDISLASLILLFDTAPLAMQGGLKKLLDQMLDVVLKNGGEVRYSMPFPEIVIRNGRAIGLKTPQDLAEAGTILLNTEQQHRGPTLFIGIRDEVVPVCMSQVVLCLPDYAQPSQYFTLSLSPKDDTSAAPKGMRALTASFPTGQHTLHGNNALMQQVGKLIPFLQEFLIFCEEYTPASRSYAVPEGVTFKPIRTSDGQPVLSRSSQRNIYLLADGWGTPLQTIRAAQRLVERLK